MSALQSTHISVQNIIRKERSQVMHTLDECMQRLPVQARDYNFQVALSKAKLLHSHHKRNDAFHHVL